MTSLPDKCESAFKISFRYRFEAAHRLTKSCADSCATPHGHTWYAKAVFQTTDSSLGNDDMVLEFSQLKRAWKSFIQDTVDHSFLHHAEDPILPALRANIPQFRGLAFPGDPTTELIAALFFAKLETMHKEFVPRDAADRVRPLSVVIRETPTNTVVFKAGSLRAVLEKANAGADGWWQQADPASRLFNKID